MDTIRSGPLTPAPQGEGGFDECWYPVALSTEVVPGQVLGRELFDGRVVVFRTQAGQASVVSAYCRHLGTDLTDGDVVDECLRCPFHHWSYDTSGVCVRTATGDRVPRSNTLFAFPTAERWGLIWAFNGTEPTYAVPGWPEPESERYFSTVLALDHSGDPFMSPLNTIDVQHIRSLHGVEITDVELREDANSLHVDMTLGSPGSHVPVMTRHAELVGTNTVVYSKTTTGIDTMASAAPYRGRSRVYLVTGGLRLMIPADSIADVVAEREKLSLDVLQEDLQILERIGFRADTLTSSDRSLVTFLQWLARYPRSHSSGPFIR